jgi:diguanylate cyclase (GGDEF)-like protein/PAS domain S-box-containing protein
VEALREEMTGQIGGLRKLDPFRVLAASAPVGIMLVDVAGTVGYVNPQCRAITGVDDDNGTVRPWLAAIDPRDRKLVFTTIRHAMASDDTQNVTFRLRHRPGTWGRLLLVPAPSEVDRRMYTVWLEDVTAEREVRAEVERLSIVLEQSSDFVTIIDTSGRMLYANETVREFFDVGIGTDLNEMPRGLGFTEMSQWRMEHEVFPALARHGVWSGELTLVAPDGHEVPILQTSKLHRDRDGRPAFVAGIGRDVTELKETELRLAASETRFRSIAQHSLDLVTIIDAEGRISYASPSHHRVLGYELHELLGRQAFELVHPDDVETVRSGFWTGGHEAKPSEPVEYRMLHHDGAWRYVEAAATPLFNEPTVRGIVVNARDITDRKLVEDRLAHFAFHDPLAGIPERAHVIERIGRTLARSQFGDSPAVLFLLDLDHFGEVNDRLGRPAADQLLLELGERLLTGMRPNDFVARIGGDEFVIVCEGLHERVAYELGMRLLDIVRMPFRVNGEDVVISASIGVAVAASDDAAAWLHEADEAMHFAKRRGRGRVASCEDRAQDRIA